MSAAPSTAFRNKREGAAAGWAEDVGTARLSLDSSARRSGSRRRRIHHRTRPTRRRSSSSSAAVGTTASSWALRRLKKNLASGSRRRLAERAGELHGATEDCRRRRTLPSILPDGASRGRQPRRRARDGVGAGSTRGRAAHRRHDERADADDHRRREARATNARYSAIRLSKRRDVLDLHTRTCCGSRSPQHRPIVLGHVREQQHVQRLDAITAKHRQRHGRHSRTTRRRSSRFAFGTRGRGARQRRLQGMLAMHPRGRGEAASPSPHRHRTAPAGTSASHISSAVGAPTRTTGSHGPRGGRQLAPSDRAARRPAGNAGDPMSNVLTPLKNNRRASKLCAGGPCARAARSPPGPHGQFSLDALELVAWSTSRGGGGTSWGPNPSGVASRSCGACAARRGRRVGGRDPRGGAGGPRGAPGRGR